MVVIPKYNDITTKLSRKKLPNYGIEIPKYGENTSKVMYFQGTVIISADYNFGGGLQFWWRKTSLVAD